MTQEQGLIARVDDKGWAEVVTQRKNACGDCRSAHCCTAFVGSSKMLVKALNRAGASEGDLVAIDLASGNVIKNAAILYVIPILGLIFGAVIGSTLDPEWPFEGTEASTLFTVLGLALGLLVTVLISRRLSKRSQFTPVITGILRAGAGGTETPMAEDPVCEALVDPAEAPESFDYQGKTYYFCDSRCRDRFAEHPAEFL